MARSPGRFSAATKENGKNRPGYARLDPFVTGRLSIRDDERPLRKHASSLIDKCPVTKVSGYYETGGIMRQHRFRQI